MIDISAATVRRAIVHRVGNKLREDGVQLSDADFPRSPALDELLLRAFLAPVVRNGAEFEFFHESNLSLNTSYHYSRRAFANARSFRSASEALAKHLYSCSDHPNIGAGEFIVILFDGVLDDGAATEALGLFRIEAKDEYLDIHEANDDIRVRARTGVSLSRVQKGAVIVAGSYRVMSLDNLSQKTKYWTREFLKVAPRQTPQLCARAVGRLVTAVSRQVSSPSESVAFARRIGGLLGQSEQVSLADVETAARSAVGDQLADRALEMVRRTYAIPLDRQSNLDTSMLRKHTKEATTTTRVAEGVTVVLSDPNAAVSSAVVRRSRDGSVRIVLDIAYESQES